MIMRKLAIVALLAFLLGGITACTSKVPYQYGNFAPPSAVANLNETIVADTVKQLIELYPPASTRFDFGQPATDAYGTQLVQSLRLNGYALSEFVPCGQWCQCGRHGWRVARPEPSLRD